jgi:hypothetical protein
VLHSFLYNKPLRNPRKRTYFFNCQFKIDRVFEDIQEEQPRNKLDHASNRLEQIERRNDAQRELLILVLNTHNKEGPLVPFQHAQCLL